MDLQLNLSEKEKSDVLELLTYLSSHKIEDFVKKFYKYFLNPKTLKFLKKSTNETLINMFTSFINIILTHLQHPIHMQEHLGYLLEQQPEFKELMDFSYDFTDAFIKSLDDFLEDKATEEVIALWTSVINQYVKFINSYI